MKAVDNQIGAIFPTHHEKGCKFFAGIAVFAKLTIELPPRISMFPCEHREFNNFSPYCDVLHDNCSGNVPIYNMLYQNAFKL